jgi:hypothetical protein
MQIAVGAMDTCPFGMAGFSLLQLKRFSPFANP